MAKEFRFRWCPLSRLAALQEFIDQHWKKGHVLARDAELLRWQYRNPHQADSLSVLIAEDGDEIAGMLGVIFVGFAQAGQRLPGAMLAMWLARVEDRRGGLGLQLMQELRDQECPFIGVMGIATAALPIYRALRYSVVDRVPRLARVFSIGNFESLLSAETAGLYTAETRAIWTATATAVTAGELTGELSVDWTAEMASRWDHAWQKHFAPRASGGWRDAAFLDWRYVNHPRFEYTIRVAMDPGSDEITGLVVYRIVQIQNRPERVLRIVEFLATESSGPRLAAEVLRVGTEQAVAFADFYCTSIPSGRWLEEVGFVREQQQPVHLPTLFSPLDFRRGGMSAAFSVTAEIAPDSREYFRDRDFYFTAGDGDQDRPN